jgi:hypothetical protein
MKEKGDSIAYIERAIAALQMWISLVFVTNEDYELDDFIAIP